MADGYPERAEALLEAMTEIPYGDVGRRVLGHLPAWHPDEDWVRAQEGEGCARSYTISELASRLAGDSSLPRIGWGLAGVLGGLAAAGLAIESADGEWRMTARGLAVLEGEASPAGQVPGPAQIGA